jgi:hypothetical protein
METIMKITFMYPFSLMFLSFVASLSLHHLWVNNKAFNEDYKLVIWPFVLCSIVILFSVLYYFVGDFYRYIPTGIFLGLSYISSEFKSSFPRTTNGDNLKEVFGRYTPKFPVTRNSWDVKMWHLKMDMLALIGLWVFILLDCKVIPWIKSFLM